MTTHTVRTVRIPGRCVGIHPRSKLLVKIFLPERTSSAVVTAPDGRQWDFHSPAIRRIVSALLAGEAADEHADT